jgi:transposase
MRATTLINKCLGLQGLWAASLQFIDGNLIIGCRKRGKKGFCPICGKRVRSFYDHHERIWRHLPMFGLATFLVVTVRRVNCPRCGVRVERVPWARHDSDFTRPFEDAVAWLLRRTNQTAVARWFGIAWETVGNIAKRVVDELLDPGRLKGLEAIGVDEFGFGHGKVITLVVNHSTGGLIWAAEGKGSDVLGAFFKILGKEGRKKIRIVTIDMSAAYRKAVEEWLPEAEIEYDPFHVTKLVIKALDEVRRDEIKKTKDVPRGVLRRLIYALRKNPWNLKDEEAASLREVSRANQRIYRGYLLKECVLKFYQYAYPVAAEKWLRKAINWAARSRLKPFVRLSRTLRKHLDGIMAFLKTGISNGILEATCRHLRLLNARAYGYASAESFIAMAFLHRGCIDIELPWNHPHFL